MFDNAKMLQFDEDRPSGPRPGDVERFLAVICHVSVLLSVTMIALAFPIACFLFGRSAFVRENARQALNFQINILIWVVIAFVTKFVGIGFIIGGILFLCEVVLPLMGVFNAKEGNIFNYPLCFPVLKRK